MSKIERTIDELYADDSERADAVVFGRETGVNRRGFLGGAGLAAMGAAVGGAIPFAHNMPAGLIPAALAQAPAAPAKGPQYLNFPGKDAKLVLLGDRPLVAETPAELLDDATTPFGKFFVRNNGQIPDEAKEPNKWEIAIDGEVNKPLKITLGELKSKYKPQTMRFVLECGGNGRSGFNPPARGNQWTNGGAGCAEWTGVRLADVLKTAGVKPSGIYTAHYAADLHLSGDASKPTLVARRAHRESDGPQQHDRLGDEWATAAEYPRRSGAADLSRLGRIDVAEMGDEDHHSRQGARWSGHDRVLLSHAHQADDSRRQGRSGEYENPGIDAGALDHHQPRQWRQVARGTRDLELRGAAWAGDNLVESRYLDRLRVELEAGQGWASAQPL